KRRRAIGCVVSATVRARACPAKRGKAERRAFQACDRAERMGSLAEGTASSDATPTVPGGERVVNDADRPGPLSGVPNGAGMFRQRTDFSQIAPHTTRAPTGCRSAPKTDEFQRRRRWRHCSARFGAQSGSTQATFSIMLTTLTGGEDRLQRAAL